MEKLTKFLKAVRSWIIKFRIELIVIGAVLVADIVTKSIVENSMRLGQTIVIIPNLLQFTYHLNSGAAFGSFSDARIFFLIVPGLAIIGFGYFLFYKKHESRLLAISVAMVLSGALGNYYDRLFNGGQVRDFIEFVYLGLKIFGSYTFAIFNIADAALTVGVVILSVYIIFFYKEPDKTNKTQGLTDSAADSEEGEDVQ